MHIAFRMLRRRMSSLSAKRAVSDLLKITPSTLVEGTPIVAEGWIKSIRHLKNSVFFHLDDGSSVNALQVMVQDAALRSLPLTFGSAVSVKGMMVVSPASKQPVEMVAQEIQIIQKNDPMSYPFKFKGDHHVDYYRQYLHLRPRAERFASLLRVRNTATMAVHEFFQDNKFILIHTPILTSNDCEGGGETFNVMGDKEASEKRSTANASEGGESSSGDTANKILNQKRLKEFFGRPVVLTVSGQLHLEAAVCGLSRVYNFNPAFRAERQQSKTHLSEFWMVEAEVAFMNSLDDLLILMETMLKEITNRVIARVPDDFQYHAKMLGAAENDHKEKIQRLLNNQFVRVRYEDAIKILEQHGSQLSTQPKSGENLSREHELFLVKHFGNLPVFVTYFPSCVKPFYARECDDDPTYALAADLIVPDVGELFGGSLREHRYDVLVQKCKTGNLLDKLDWYLELRKFGGPPTGGFGMGFERFLQFLLGIQSIKDVAPFPRWINQCDL